MSDSDDTPPMPPDMRAMFEAMNENSALHEKIKEFADHQNQKVESEVLMQLWQTLGDNTETYWEAFHAAHSFTGAVQKIRRQMKGFQPGLRSVLLDNLATLLRADAESMRNLERLQQEHQHGTAAIEPEED